MGEYIEYIKNRPGTKREPVQAYGGTSMEQLEIGLEPNMTDLVKIRSRTVQGPGA